jgi:hypothetical protein
VHKARCSSCKILIKDENEHQTHLEKSTSDGTECKEIDGLSKEAMASLKQLKPTAGDRQARWEILYTHLFPEGSSMPNPCKDYIATPKFLVVAISVKLTA